MMTVWQTVRRTTNEILGVKEILNELNDNHTHSPLSSIEM